ncbi:hypothetical protein OF83DRAFT_1117308 [Amylostereum chailletii]|nr:hypothetical protein OF83DRAFT_1117308 [Amylostereum chailletii]
MPASPPTFPVEVSPPKSTESALEDAVDIVRARWIPRGATLYDDIGEIIRVGSRLEASDNSLQPDGLNMSTARKNRFRCVYPRILDSVPGLREFIVSMPSSTSLDRVITKITKRAQNARGEDTANLRAVLDLFPCANGVDSLLDPPLTHSKKTRGTNHPDLARWLCPAEDISLGRKMLRDGRIPVEGDRYLLGLYKDGIFNPKNPEAGLFQSASILKAGRLIFTGKATIREGFNPQGLRGNLKANNVRKIDGYHIASVIVQTRFAASSFETWTPIEATGSKKIGSNTDVEPYSYVTLYNCIVFSLEDDPDDEFACHVKAVWNLHILGTADGIEDEEERVQVVVEQAEPSSWQIMVGLRAARSNARKEKEGSTDIQVSAPATLVAVPTGSIQVFPPDILPARRPPPPAGNTSGMLALRGNYPAARSSSPQPTPDVSLEVFAPQDLPSPLTEHTPSPPPATRTTRSTNGPANKRPGKVAKDAPLPKKAKTTRKR